MATKKKTTRAKKLPRFTVSDYFLREHPFIVKLEKMFRRIISNANDTKSKTITDKDLTAFDDFLTKSTDAEIREVKKYLKWYKNTITFVPSGLSKEDKKRAMEVAKINRKLCNDLMDWIKVTI